MVSEKQHLKPLHNILLFPIFLHSLAIFCLTFIFLTFTSYQDIKNFNKTERLKIQSAFEQLEQMLIGELMIGDDQALRAIISNFEQTHKYRISLSEKFSPCTNNLTSKFFSVLNYQCMSFKIEELPKDYFIQLSSNKNYLAESLLLKYLFLALLSVCLFCGSLIFLSSKLLKKEVTDPINQIAKAPDNPSNKKRTRIYEIYTLRKHIQNFIIIRQKQVVANEIAFLSTQLAHDIRSPLSALDLIVASLTDVPEEKRLIIRNASQRIKDIANNLLEKNKEQEKGQRKDLDGSTSTQTTSQSSARQTTLVADLVEEITSEKRTQFRDKIHIEINSSISETAYGVFANINASEMKRMISNLVNNSVEAMPEQKGQITIALNKEYSNSFELTITDNGQGIPPHVLSKLGQRGVSHGKASSTESGSGLGVYHAKTTLESWGGKLLISSSPNVKTDFTLQLPLATPPPWFVPQITITPQTTIVVLDDDISIHEVWQNRFAPHKNSLIKISSPEDLRRQVQVNSINSSYLYLCDQELLGHTDTGLDLIKELNLQEQSILVTSRFAEPQIQEQLKSLKIKCIPKNMARFVPIQLNK